METTASSTLGIAELREHYRGMGDKTIKRLLRRLVGLRFKRGQHVLCHRSDVEAIDRQLAEEAASRREAASRIAVAEPGDDEVAQRRAFVRRIAGGGMAALLFALAPLPAMELAGVDFSQPDKVDHALWGFSAGMTTAYALSMTAPRMSMSSRFLATVGSGFVAGLLLELRPDNHVEAADVVATGLGSVVAGFGSVVIELSCRDPETEARHALGLAVSWRF